MTEITIKQITEALGATGNLLSVKKLGGGIINQTFLVTFLEGKEKKDYIIQRINPYVFENPEHIMSNIALITRHIKGEYEALHQNADRKVLHFLYTKDGKNYIFDGEGALWRGYRFVENSVCFTNTESLKIIEGAGFAFGSFQRCLKNFDPSVLYETIPDFHNTKKRFEALFCAAEENNPRVEETKSKLSYLKSVFDEVCVIGNLAESGTLPLRVTHNDTKCSNVLFDETTGEPLAVIDLDTVMPGRSVYDYGDAIRSSANTVAEDSSDYAAVALDLDRFKAFTKGFLTGADGCLYRAEIENLARGAFTMTAEQAARFLLDYITGDKYFKTDYEKHNLVRTRNQIALCKDIEKKQDKMNEIINEIKSAFPF